MFDFKNILDFFRHKFKVYPNPISRELYIESGDFKYNKVEITDLKGNVVLSRSINYEPKIQLPVSLIDEMYVVKISNDKQSQLKKIVVKK